MDEEDVMSGSTRMSRWADVNVGSDEDDPGAQGQVNVNEETRGRKPW